MKVIGLIVTYNRKNLLIESLQALLNQTHKLKEIVVIDNNSTDGTSELFSNSGLFEKKGITYRKMDNNIGGAGGFYEGIKYIHENCDYDFLWLMDDDTISYPNSLEQLLIAYNHVKKEQPSFLASTVYGPEKEPMNVPGISTRKHENGYVDWYRYLKHGIVQIERATFVSLLISNKGIEKVGYPIKEYFIWGDDTEYTLRLVNNYGPAFFVGSSLILHKRYNAKSLNIITEDNPNRAKMYKYFYRNKLFNSRLYDSRKTIIKNYLNVFRESFRILVNKNCQYRIKKFVAIQKGISESILSWSEIRKYADK
ncbi:glycosyltransferase family 2 protein [Vagococcus lutrae]|uniref:Glycosyltransferase family 2 protein n=1 Tax=Vagococcus lutrae TaxID=81947 RepID=A0AAF0BCI7_9ENTE|nr:glycosyltransferase family 2 protein [Vagococcus lutrae]WCG22713.1 glycosyltransferase family 2 protein [Vagococcus lutrae]